MPNLEDINEIEIDLDFNDIIENTCKELSQDIKQEAQQMFGNGEYANNWIFKIVKKKNKKDEGVVYNKDTYRLSHLLENGHIIKNQYGTYGRTQPKPHIKPQFDKIKGKFIEQMSSCKYKLKIK